MTFPYSESVSNERDWNWPWLSPWDRMKFRTDASTFVTCSNFKAFPQNQLLNDAMKVHAEFGIMFVHFSPNSNFQTSCLCNHTWSPICCHALFVHDNWSSFMVSHTLKNKSSLVFVPRRLLRVATSSTTSNNPVMPRMVINYWAVPLVSLISSFPYRIFHILYFWVNQVSYY
jgi:hypothetical protein